MLVFIIWRQCGFLVDPEPRISTCERPLGLLLSTLSLGCLFSRVNPQKHCCSCGDVWTPGGTWISCFMKCLGPLILSWCSIRWLAGLCDRSWLLSVVQPPWFRACIKLIGKQCELTAPTYCYGSHAQLHLADSPWSLFCACVVPLTWHCAWAGFVHREAGAVSPFFLLLKLFGLVVGIKCT